MDNRCSNSQKGDRRHLSLNDQELWAELNMAQRVAASALYHYDYNLCFIRSSPSEKLVVMLLDDKPATINTSGDINISPDINFRL